MSHQRHLKAKRSGRSRVPPFVMLPHWIIDSEEFGALDATALKLMLDLARVYSGKNNGDLSVRNIPRARWRSDQKRVRATKILIDTRWILKTKQGGLGMGPDLFALTWLPVDHCDGKHSHPAEVTPSHVWRKKTPLPIRELIAPDSGTGTTEKKRKTPALVPDSGAMEPLLKVS